MNKIFNWTFGSIFRTLGRIIAYIIIAIIAVMIFNAGGFKKPKISNILNDLFFMKVDALSLDGYNDGEINLGSSMQYAYLDSEYPDDSWNFNDFYSNEEDYIIIPISGIEAYKNEVNIFNNTDNDFDIVSLAKAYIKIYIFTNDNSGNQACEIQNNLVVCPLKHFKTYTRLETHFITGGTPSGLGEYDIRVIYHNYGILYRKDSTIIMNEDYENAQDIINAINGLKSQQEAETNQTIQNQNQNTQTIIEANMSCTIISKDNISISNKYLNGNGSLIDNNVYGVTDYIKIDNKTKIKITVPKTQDATYCFYNIDKEIISCSNNYAIIDITIPNNAQYFRASIHSSQNKPQFEICQNGNQAMVNAITDSNVSEANSSAGGFFNNFSTTDNGGLSSIITSPLSAIQSLTSASCSSLVLPLPFVNEDLTLPCMRTIYESNFGGFMTLYDVITLGIISYWILVRIFNLVKDFKNPDHDEIEVVDL